MIEIVKGNAVDAVLNGEVDVLMHVVNCRGVMGSGIAKEIRRRTPEVYTKYMENFHEEWPENPKELLGSVDIVRLPNRTKVFNLYAQLNYGRDGKRYINYAALCESLNWVKSCATNISVGSIIKTIGIPYNMGCGLAGGDWEIVTECLDYHFPNHRIIAYKL